MRIFYFLCLLVWFGLASCQKKSLRLEPSKDCMRICLNMDPSTIDPRKSAEWCASTLNFLIYEGLTRIKPDGDAELALAQSIDLSEDGLVYTFHLRDAYWSDGAPITAYDFEYSWKKILTPRFGSPCPHLLFPLKNGEKSIKGEISQEEIGVQAIDDKTLRVELENPTPYFLSLISFCNFYPIPKHIELKNSSWQNSIDQNLVASGPYKLVKWLRNKEILLEKNPLYWNSDQLFLPRIHISIIPDEKTALKMYENEELDFISTVTTPLSLEDLDYFRKQGKLQVIPLGGLLFCTFNLDRFPFQNSNIRKALSYAIDRKAIVENIYQLTDIPATRCIPPVLIGKQNRQLFPAHDRERARILFAKGIEELGLSDLPISQLPFFHSLILSYEGIDPHRKIAQTIQQQWKEVLGIEVKLQEEDPKTHMDQLFSRNYSIAIDYLIVQYNDPNNILERFKYKNMKKNFPGFENSGYIDLLNQAACMNNAKKRLEILEAAETLLMTEMPLTPIYHFNQGLLIDSKFTNLEFSPLGNLLFLKIRPTEKI